MFSAARWQLTLVFTIVLVLILGGSGAVVYLTTRSVIYDRVDSDLAKRARDDVVMLTHETEGPRPAPRPEPDFDTGGYFYALVDSGGQLLAASSNFDQKALAPSSTRQEATADGEAYTNTTGSSGDPKRLYVISVQTFQGDPALLQVGRSTQPEQNALWQLRNILIAVAAFSAVPAMLGGYLLSGRALGPIKKAMDSQRVFIADASHELRTPVSVVHTNAEILQRHLESGTIGRAGDAIAVEDILSESERMGRMVGQMLTLAEADADKAAPSPSVLALDQLAEEVSRSMRALAEGKGVAMTAGIERGIAVRGDRERLREVLVTVLDNAIKYTDAGGRVEVNVTKTHRRAVVTITDTGCGIPAASLPHIFERFYRVDKARSRESGGTGLGLAIARQTVEAHGGTIHINSEVGRGTTVTIELRLAGAEPAANGAQPE